MLKTARSITPPPFRRSLPTLLAGLLALAALSVAAPATPTYAGTTAPPPRVAAPPAPRTLTTSLPVMVPPAAGTIALGARIEDNGLDAPEDPAAMDNFAALVGRMPSVVMWYQTWGEAYPDFSARSMDDVRARGAVPMVTWEPWNGTANDPTYKLSNITRGDFDPYIRQWAMDAKAWGHPFFLRFAEEMNGTWFSWGVGAGNANGNTPADYIAAWQHVHDIFTSVGATNAIWVWAPNVFDGSGSWPNLSSFYPGDAYVDWVGLDGYNDGTDTNAGYSGWQTFTQVFGASYAALTALTAKPVMIAETASAEQSDDPATQNKAEWITSAFLTEIPASFPRVQLVTWFDKDKETDWRVNSSAASLNAFRNVVASPLYQGQFSEATATTPQPTPATATSAATTVPSPVPPATVTPPVPPAISTPSPVPSATGVPTTSPANTSTPTPVPPATGTSFPVPPALSTPTPVPATGIPTTSPPATGIPTADASATSAPFPAPATSTPTPSTTSTPTASPPAASISTAIPPAASTPTASPPATSTSTASPPATSAPTAIPPASRISTASPPGTSPPAVIPPAAATTTRIPASTNTPTGIPAATMTPGAPVVLSTPTGIPPRHRARPTTTTSRATMTRRRARPHPVTPTRYAAPACRASRNGGKVTASARRSRLARAQRRPAHATTAHAAPSCHLTGRGQARRGQARRGRARAHHVARSTPAHRRGKHRPSGHLKAKPS